MNIELQELKIPAGWFVSYNQFYNLSPSKDTVESIDTVFTEDILQLKNKDRNRLLDLGWYPEGEFNTGNYRLVVYEKDFHGTLLHELKTKDKQKVVSEINRLLRDISNGSV
jgi:hypothetical protein